MLLDKKERRCDIREALGGFSPFFHSLTSAFIYCHIDCVFLIVSQGQGGVPGIDGLSGDKGDKVSGGRCSISVCSK